MEKTGRQRSQHANDKALDLAIIHLTFEGIQTFGGGVASVIRGHLGALPQIHARLAQEGIRVTPYFAEIAYSADHERRDPKFQAQAEAAISSMGGRFEYLVNYSPGELPRGPWGVPDLGTIDNWKTASASGAAFALNVARRHEVTVMYGHDTIFALAPLYATLQEVAFGADLTGIYVMHATALTHELPLPNPERLMVESAAVHWAKVTPRCKLGYISKFMARHVALDYGAKPEHQVPTGNGINPLDLMFRLRTKDTVVKKLDEYGIPTDRPLVFSWGRAVEYKRYDVVLQAAAKLKGQIHPVIMVTPRWDKLVDLDRQLGTNCTFVFAFDPELVACLLQWERTEAAASLAYLEPGGLTPMETRMHARRSGALMVVSDTGGLVEQIADGVDGFITAQDDPEDVARVLKRILDMPRSQKDKIRKAGLQTVLNNYTWTSQILKTLSAVVPQVDRTADRVRDRIVREVAAKLPV
ncbi:MAG: glycosyltransferase family 4 protein [Chloroflexi bacterium]|nr:glycosyltransferase family 4 protein [Chloroflexota bacterium]